MEIMRAKQPFLLLILVLLVQSCGVVSFYPLYTDETVIENDQIIGVWENSEDEYIWEISKPDTLKSTPFSFGDHNGDNNKYSYMAIVYMEDEPEQWTEFMIHLVKLGSNTYADIFPYSWKYKNENLMAHMVPVHSFARVTLDSAFTVAQMDQKLLKDLIEHRKVRIPYVEDEDGKTLILARPEELQKFLIKYDNAEAGFFNEFIWTLTRLNGENKDR